MSTGRVAQDRGAPPAQDLPPPVTRLAADVWRPLERAHQEQVDALTADHLARRGRGVEHPVEDFLFTYYAHRPAQLRRWHPGVGVQLVDAAERAGWSGYRVEAGVAYADAESFVAARGALVAATRSLLRATLARPAQLGCLGLHEWAMVFRASADAAGRRHPAWPLRLGAAGTDAVVESHVLRCTHFDAYRFFTPEAAPRNAVAPRSDTREQLEQPGCLHAVMDVYKLAFRLTPLVPSALVLDCFELAREVRELDMRASPYDLRALGYAPVEVETAAGKAAYVAAQRGFAARGQALRRRLLDVLAYPSLSR